tara:strand:- start:11352 stop:11600 length:249 start_codon:yes stop_codon:yes gene_type:complete
MKFNWSWRKEKERPIKKIFQWREYLNWKEMTPQQRLNFKRACCFPLFAYAIFIFLKSYIYAIFLIITILFLLRLKDRDKLTK